MLIVMGHSIHTLHATSRQGRTGPCTMLVVDLAPRGCAYQDVGCRELPGHAVACTIFSTKASEEMSLPAACQHENTRICCSSMKLPTAADPGILAGLEARKSQRYRPRRPGARRGPGGIAPLLNWLHGFGLEAPKATLKRSPL
ncbi:uncharacterized protein LOC115316857 [Ixodes scapularis]|uniref:uncharacterized protein LOC115316857 n=1 Tax=Ixodes scapularis TaxID=6945 RepID=UPI001A9EBED5|nr:uncharacterized protein LOC115316857 [Ixodes scapularis]